MSRCRILTFRILYQPNETPQLPTSTNFEHLVNTPNTLLVDKTVYIEKLDRDPNYQELFLRPRGWGKTTFLQMLASYYDRNKAHEFDNTFGQLYIGKNPTRHRSSLLVLVFDFSSTSAVDYNEADRQLNSTTLHTLRKFLETNERFLGYPTADSLLGKDGVMELLQVLVSLLLSVSAILTHSILRRTL
jgi:hypothetical protein